jgi:hypothetical protein
MEASPLSMPSLANGVAAMKRLFSLCIILGVLSLFGGCATEADKVQWNEALKDLRGDNMKMHDN